MSDNESSDNTTAFEVTDAPLSMAVVESERSPYDNATASGGADEFATASGGADDLTNNQKSRISRKHSIYLTLERGMLERQMTVPLPSDQSVQQPLYAGNSKKPA